MWPTPKEVSATFLFKNLCGVPLDKVKGILSRGGGWVVRFQCVTEYLKETGAGGRQNARFGPRAL